MQPDPVRDDLENLRSDERSVYVAASLRLSSCRRLAPILVEMLKTERREPNRQAILYALSWQGDVRAWWPLLKVLADVSGSTPVRRQAAEGIAYTIGLKSKTSLGYKIGIDVLIWLLTDPSVEVRYDALFALGASLDPAVLPHLQRMTDDPGTAPSVAGTVAEEARDAIGWISHGTPRG